VCRYVFVIVSVSEYLCARVCVCVDTFTVLVLPTGVLSFIYCVFFK